MSKRAVIKRAANEEYELEQEKDMNEQKNDLNSIPSDGFCDEDLQENIVGSERLYHGRVLDLERLQVSLPDGSVQTREVVRHHGGAAILALNAESEVLLVRQFRAATGEILCEIPAGKLELNEDPLLCAQRELAEETGYHARKWQKLSTMFPSPGYTSERLHLYLAEELSPGEQHLDQGEFLHAFRLPFSEALKWVEDGRICDAKSALALLQTAMILQKRQETPKIR